MDNETTAGPSAHRDTDEPRASPPLFVRRPRQRTLQMEEATQEHNDPSTPAAKPNRLLLLVKLTGSRLLALTLVIAYGTMKLIPALRQSALTWLDVLLGISTGIAALYLGWLETVRPPLATWFFHEDLTLDLFFFSTSLLLFALVPGALWTSYLFITIRLASSGSVYAIACSPFVFILMSAGVYFVVMAIAKFLKVKGFWQGYIDRREIYPFAWHDMSLVVAASLGFIVLPVLLLLATRRG